MQNLLPPPPSSARSISGLEGVSQYKIKAVLTADGSEYVEEAFIQKSSSSSVTITFPAVRAGSRAKIIVHILIGNYEYARGESDEITVKAGSNFLIIKIGKNAILPIILYNQINSEKVFSLSSNPDSAGDYKVEIDNDNSVPFTPKAKLFTFINGGESPADGDLDIPYTQYTSYGTTITTYYTPTYSFGDNCLYWLYQNKVYVYTAPDYNQTDELDLISKFKEINTDLASATLTIKGLAYYDGNLYFFINYNSQYYFAAYNLEDQNLIFVSYNFNTTPCDSLAVTKIGENYILCSINASTIALYIQEFTITKNENDVSILTLDETPSNIAFPVTGSDFYGSYGQYFGGLQILGNTLYVTCYFYRATSNDVQAYFLNPNTDSIFPVMSAGGLGKIDLSSTSYEFGTWSNGEKLLGLYKNYYYLKNENDESYIKSSNAVIMTPPEDKASSYFYGAKRIIAKKQDEIVIADDGAYVEIKGDRTDPDAIKKCVNKNRVVTVNLKNESISAVDVNASFSSTLGTGTFYGIE
ncbi:hypothetical protein [Treponema sp. UBA3813]|uniref:hypothetical protein n=1 Tax=Treponema sp. UBA3813 TaxID=1947715 RepID=UPI0025EB4BEC|nr:hypothetical protein [Treponema sp. UBA3813]